VQNDPIKPVLKAPENKRLKLKCDEPFSKLAFKFNVRRYILVFIANIAYNKFYEAKSALGRGLHSFTFRLNVSALCGIGVACRGCLRGA
jgi:hypothetical protein